MVTKRVNYYKRILVLFLPSLCLLPCGNINCALNSHSVIGDAEYLPTPVLGTLPSGFNEWVFSVVDTEKCLKCACIVDFSHLCFCHC